MLLDHFNAFRGKRKKKNISALLSTKMQLDAGSAVCNQMGETLDSVKAQL